MKLEKKFMLGTTVQLNKIISPNIAKVKIYVMYAGKNRNQTYFTKEMIEQKLVPTMYGMPIIGEYLEKKSDFGGHGGKVIIKDDEIEYVQTTRAYGFIPESAEVKWEKVTEVNGLEREYLVADGYVWHKRFPEVSVILDEPRNQSMEIEIVDGEWSDELNAYNIKDAYFDGACILGLDVEPCFEEARIGKFALEQMKFELSEMAKELKETLLQSEVTEEMHEEFETLVEETVETQEETVEETVEEVVEETVEAQEEVQEEVQESQEEEPAVEEEVVETEVETTEEAVEETQEEVQEETTEEITEEQPQEEPVVEEQEGTVEEEVETVDFAKENADLKAQIEAYEAELAELRAFKAEKEMQEKQEVVESFRNEFTEEELQPIVEKMEEFSKDDLEIQLFALLGKKQKQYSAQNQERVENEKVLTVASYELDEEVLPSWARAIEQHTKK